MNPDESYSNNVSITIPDDFADSCYLHVLTNANDAVFEYAGAGNNYATELIIIKTPDLIVDSANVIVSEIIAGGFAELEWTIRNAGNGKVNAATRNDGIWISSSSVFSSSIANLISAFSYNTTMDSNATLFRQASVKISDSISGKRYLLLRQITAHK